MVMKPRYVTCCPDGRKSMGMLEHLILIASPFIKLLVLNRMEQSQRLLRATRTLHHLRLCHFCPGLRSRILEVDKNWDGGVFFGVIILVPRVSTLSPVPVPI